MRAPTPSYVPMSYPAVADFELVGAMLAAARTANQPAHAGIVRSHDALYTDLHAARMPRREELEGALEVWIGRGCYATTWRRRRSSSLRVAQSPGRLRLTVVNEPGEEAIDPARVAALDTDADVSGCARCCPPAGTAQGLNGHRQNAQG